MKLTPMFQKNGKSIVKDQHGDIYSLKLVQKATHEKPQPVILPPTPGIEADDKLLSKIHDMLKSLEAPSNYSGYELLVHCLYFTIKYKQCRERLSVSLYPKVARMHNILSGSVPGSLSTLISHWSQTYEYKKLFGTKSIGPKNLILNLTDYYLIQN